MSKVLWNALLLGPAVLGASLAIAEVAIATEVPALGTPVSSQTQLKSDLSPGASPAIAQAPPAPTPPATPVPGPVEAEPGSTTAPDAQTPTPPTPPNTGVTSVSQLSDVDPNSYAFQALQSLVERYGCIAGYPDGTFRGNRALTRYEFAAGLNACTTSLEDRVRSSADRATIKRLEEEFTAELATLRGRTDSLEARITDLEAQQFSTTTKLTGEVIFQAPSFVEGDVANTGGRGIDTEIIFGYRARLNFDTSFTGSDRLRVRLEAADIPNYATVAGTNMARLSVDTNTGGNFAIDDLLYRLPLGENGNLTIAANRTEFYDAIDDTFNPLLSGEGQGSLSRFGRFNPIYRQLETGTGAILNYNLSNSIRVSAGYLAASGDATDPTREFGDISAGLFGGSYAAIGQLAFRPSENFGFGFTYARSFFPGGAGVSGATGSTFADNPFAGAPTAANSYGFETSLRLSPRFVVSGWAGYTQAYAENATANDADILNYAVTLGFPDLVREGNLGAIIFGQPPKVLNNDIATRDDPDTSFHIEGLYRFRVTNNITIAPGVFVILNPQHNDANDPIFVGTVRTTFTF